MEMFGLWSLSNGLVCWGLPHRDSLSTRYMFRPDEQRGAIFLCCWNIMLLKEADRIRAVGKSVPSESEWSDHHIFSTWGALSNWWSLFDNAHVRNFHRKCNLFNVKIQQFFWFVLYSYDMIINAKHYMIITLISSYNHQIWRHFPRNTNNFL